MSVFLFPQDPGESSKNRSGKRRCYMENGGGPCVTQRDLTSKVRIAGTRQPCSYTRYGKSGERYQIRACLRSAGAYKLWLLALATGSGTCPLLDAPADERQQVAGELLSATRRLGTTSPRRSIPIFVSAMHSYPFDSIVAYFRDHERPQSLPTIVPKSVLFHRRANLAHACTVYPMSSFPRIPRRIYETENGSLIGSCMRQS